MSTAHDSGLISSTPRPKPPVCETNDGRIPIGATLVIAPSHLLEQWQDEFRKFLKENDLEEVATAPIYYPSSSAGKVGVGVGGYSPSPNLQPY